MYRTGPLLAALVAAMALASCGGGGSSSAGTAGAGSISSARDGAGTAATPPAESRTTASKTPACVRSSPHSVGKSANSCGGGAGEGSCGERIGEFVDRMDDLRQSLLAGLSYAEYVVRVRGIRDAYEAVPVEKLGVACLEGAARDAEDAFNQYLRAANAWGECAGTEGCAASEIEGRLQHRWRIASRNLDAARKG